jgi:hypothetical protein
LFESVEARRSIAGSIAASVCPGLAMKYVEPSIFADLDVAARKLVEIAKRGRGGSSQSELLPFRVSTLKEPS